MTRRRFAPRITFSISVLARVRAAASWSRKERSRRSCARRIRRRRITFRAARASKFRSAGSRRDRAVASSEGWISLRGATENNLKNVTAAFPLGCLTCVTGVSGSGKSTLVDDTLRRALFRHFYNSKDKPGAHAGLHGLDQLDKAIVIDQTRDRPDAALEPDHLHRRVHADPRVVQPAPDRARARLRCGAFQLQCERRALRKLRRRRADQNRDALPAGRLCGVRSLPRAALQSRDARNYLQGQKHRRRAEPHRR